MTPTDPDDSPWNDLAAELGLDSSAKPASPRPPADPPFVDDEFALDDADEPADENLDDTVVIPALQSEATAEDGDQTDEGGKKRRRRRRRRKKGTGPETATAEGEGGDDAVEGDTDADESAADEPVATSDPTGAEPASELFANWNVPAWEEIVAGLYRPER